MELDLGCGVMDFINGFKKIGNESKFNNIVYLKFNFYLSL